MKGEWKVTSKRYGSTKDYIIGRVKVGSVWYNALRSKTDIGNYYAYNANLPDLRNPEGTTETEEEAQKKVEKLVDLWFESLKSKPKG